MKKLRSEKLRADFSFPTKGWGRSCFPSPLPPFLPETLPFPGSLKLLCFLEERQPSGAGAWKESPMLILLKRVAELQQGSPLCKLILYKNSERTGAPAPHIPRPPEKRQKSRLKNPVKFPPSFSQDFPARFQGRLFARVVCKIGDFIKLKGSCEKNSERTGALEKIARPPENRQKVDFSEPCLVQCNQFAHS